MTYPLVFYTDRLPEGVGGITIGPLVFIRPKYREDRGLYEHEFEHVKQGAMLLFVGFALLYLFVRRYRLWAEVEAYNVQRCYPDRKGRYLSLDDAAYRLSLPIYRLGITQEQAKEYLKNGRT